MAGALHLDIPDGALHITCCELEGRAIVRDDRDRERLADDTIFAVCLAKQERALGQE